MVSVTLDSLLSAATRWTVQDVGRSRLPIGGGGHLDQLQAYTPDLEGTRAGTQTLEVLKGGEGAYLGDPVLKVEGALKGFLRGGGVEALPQTYGF